MLLGLSSRHVRRILRDFVSDGLPSLVHGNTGKSPKNKISSHVTERIKDITSDGGIFNGLNTCHLHDLILEREDITIGRSTLHRLLIDNHVTLPGQRKHKVRRMRRKRSPSEGMLLQIDGSSHDWLSGRSTKIALLGAVDDATGKIVHLIFRPTEDQAGYIMLIRHIARTNGLPGALYHDKHTILRSPKKASIDDELAGREPQSQVQRIIADLGITSIPADSPQAKGRIERLWGTLQDRLIKEMSMESISTLDDANAFLPGFIARFNKRFAQPAENPECAWVIPDRRLDMVYHFSTCEGRVIKKDHTVAWQGMILQLLPGKDDLILPGQSISVHMTPEGDIHVYKDRIKLKHKEICARPVAQAVAPELPAKQPDRVSVSRRNRWLFQPAA